MGRRWLSVALLVALGIAAAALAYRIGGSPGGGGGGAGRSLGELMPLLFAAAGLCVAGLLRDRAPTGAWLATVAAAALGALEVLGAVRALPPPVPVESWPWHALVGLGSILGAAAIAGLYAARATDGRSPGWLPAWRWVVLGGLGVVAAVVGWAVVAGFTGSPAVEAALAADSQSPFRTSARLAAGYVVVATFAGFLRDLAGPARRARARGTGPRDWPRTFAEEVLPGAGTMRRIGRDEERARLAADLHALVLPDLRRAATAAEASGAAAQPVAAELRQALAGVERLMHERHSVVLEQYGLVAALEWLAERTEEQSALEVVVELEGTGVDDSGAVPAPVARAAFRIAMLAVDNVVRHAGAQRAMIHLSNGSGRVRLVVADDGVGGAPGAAPASPRPSGRGIPDMRTAAAEVGASLLVRQVDGGTQVEFAWEDRGPVTGNHAGSDADLAGSPPPPSG